MLTRDNILTWQSHVYPHKWNDRAIPAFTPQTHSITELWLVFISRHAEGRLSRNTEVVCPPEDIPVLTAAVGKRTVASPTRWSLDLSAKFNFVINNHGWHISGPFWHSLCLSSCFPIWRRRHDVYWKSRMSTFRNIENGHFNLHAKFRLDNLKLFLTKIQDGTRGHVELRMKQRRYCVSRMTDAYILTSHLFKYLQPFLRIEMATATL